MTFEMTSHLLRSMPPVHQKKRKQKKRKGPAVGAIFKATFHEDGRVSHSHRPTATYIVDGLAVKVSDGSVLTFTEATVHRGDSFQAVDDENSPEMMVFAITEATDNGGMDLPL
jgi:hypothetical protein